MISTRVGLWWCLLSTILLALAIFLQGGAYPKVGGTPKLKIADFEYAERLERFPPTPDPGSAEKCVASWLRTNTYIDFVFIASYWAMFVLFARLYSGPLAAGMATAITIGALCDILDKRRLLNVLDAVMSKSGSFQSAGLLAEGKWVFLTLATVILAALLLRHTGTAYRIMASLLAIAGVEAAIGAFRHSLLTAAQPTLLISLLIALFLYFPYWREFRSLPQASFAAP
jgi:hypothetical protein